MPRSDDGDRHTGRGRSERPDGDSAAAHGPSSSSRHRERDGGEASRPHKSSHRSSRHRSPSSDSGSSSSGRSRSRSHSPRRHKHHRHHHRRERRSHSREGEARRKRDRRERSPDARDRGSKAGGAPPAAAPPAQGAPSSGAAAVAAAPSAPSAAAEKKSKKSSSLRVAELYGYTAENNPFGDSNLNDAFVWKKKIDKDVETGKRVAAPTKAEVRADREALMEEIERARARRLAREQEAEEMERLRAEELRLRDSAQYHDWEKKEEEFHLKQARQRSFIRIREARERPVDILAKNLLLAEAAERGEDEDDANRGIAMEVELNEPHAVFQSLPLAELRELRRDIGDFLDLEGPDGPNKPFWLALRAVCDDEMERVAAREASLAAGRSVAALLVVERDIDDQFEGKGEPELAIMEDSIRGTISSALAHRASGAGAGSSAAGAGAPRPSRGGAVDVEYWESVLRQLKVAQAKATLRRLHEEVLLRRLGQLEAKKAKLAGSAGPAPVPPPPAAAREPGGGPEQGGRGVSPPLDNGPGGDMDRGALDPEGSLSPQYEGGAPAAAADAAAPSPSLASSAAAAPPAASAVAAQEWEQEPAVDAAEERRRLLERRIATLRRTGVLPAEALADAPASASSCSSSSSAAAAAAASRPGAAAPEGSSLPVFSDEQGPLPTGEAEGAMGTELEVALPPAASSLLASTEAAAAAAAAAAAPPGSELYLFQDKYRPRKPRYFNRIKTGYSWGSYSKSRFTRDEPPPKEVQGYKFSIFYPDLIDKSKTPTFFLEPTENDEFCIIRFHAGPPYEDVAFMIVNKEWEKAKKYGFRAEFARGIFILNFNLKLGWYRR